MPARSLDAVFFIDAAPTITFADGLFHVGYGVGKIHAEFVMLPKIFAKAMLLAESAQAQCQYSSLARNNVTKIKSA
jgi:hypothetical protein